MRSLVKLPLWRAARRFAPASLAVALAVLAGPPELAGAHVSTRVGIGDQSVRMFTDPHFQALHVRQVRMFVAWNVMDDRTARLKAREWVQTARFVGDRPLIHVSTDNYTSKQAHLPTEKEYRSKVGRLVSYMRHLGVRDFGAWNEANHASEPTYDHPYSAAMFFKEMRRAVFKHCSSRHCRVVGLDVLDQAGVEKYIGRFIHYVGRSYTDRYLRIVGIHNYSDVNRKRTSGLRGIIQQVHKDTRRPHFWLTETGAVVRFGASFPCNPTRAGHRMSYLFHTIHAYHQYLQRVYLYNWYGEGCDGRQDVGIVGPFDTLRPTYDVIKHELPGVDT